jgi:flagellar export protein FliJ
MAFRFRLARVLRLRTRLRERTQDQLVRLRADVQALGERAERVAAERRAAREAEEAAAMQGMTGADLALHRGFDERQGACEAALAAERARVAAEESQRLAELQARRREERQLERLGERARGRWEAGEARAATCLLDELALRRRDGGR